jgi:hypothetical protein
VDGIPPPASRLEICANFGRWTAIELDGQVATGVTGLASREVGSRLDALAFFPESEIEQGALAVRAELLTHRRIGEVEREDRGGMLGIGARAVGGPARRADGSLVLPDSGGAGVVEDLAGDRRSGDEAIVAENLVVDAEPDDAEGPHRASP